MTDRALLEAIALDVAHPGFPPCLAGVNLALPASSVTIVLGSSGSGKTSLLKTLAGALAPAAGQVLLDGAPIRPGPGGAFPHIGYQMQFAERQFFAPTVREEVGFGWRRSPGGGRCSSGEGEPARSAFEREVARALGSVGLPDEPCFLERSPWSLSLGEQRRVALASVVVFRPRVLLLDEPTAGLDPPGRRALGRLVRERRDRGQSVLVAGHDLDWALAISDRVYLADQGEVRPIDLAEARGRELLAGGGYRIPDACRFFESRVSDFWAGGRHRFDLADLTRLWLAETSARLPRGGPRGDGFPPGDGLAGGRR